MEKLLQGHVISALKADFGRHGHLDPRNGCPIQPISIARGQLPDEFTLRSPIPVAEWVDRVEVAHVVSGATTKLERLAPSRWDAEARSEAIRLRLGIICCGKAKGNCPPGVEILENMPVNGLKMSRVEVPGSRKCCKLHKTASRSDAFGLIQTLRITDVPQVLRTVVPGSTYGSIVTIQKLVYRATHLIGSQAAIDVALENSLGFTGGFEAFHADAARWRFH